MDMVKITAGTGTEKEDFKIHRKLICEKSAAFEKIFNGNFLEGQTQSAVLPGDSPNTFSLFVTWLYKDIIDTRVYDLSLSLVPYFGLYSLAGKYFVEGLADKTTDTIFEIYTNNKSIRPCAMSKMVIS